MTVNQNRLKISLGGDISLQVRHIPLPYFNNFMIPTNSRLIAENAFPSTKNFKLSRGSPTGAPLLFGPHFVKTWYPQETRISFRTATWNN